MLLALFGITIIAFGLIRFIPVDPVEAYFTINQIPATEEAMTSMREEMGLDQPLWMQYIAWLSHALQLDFGTSFVSKRPWQQNYFNALRQHYF